MSERGTIGRADTPLPCIRAVLMPVASEPELVDLSLDREGSPLDALQGLVGGDVEFFDVLFGENPVLIVNENGIAERLQPNRAVFASREMKETGYLSFNDLSRPVREGELYAVLYGPIVAVSYGEDGNARDITEDEFEALKREFGGAERYSGLEAVAAVRNGWVADYEQMRAERMSGAAASLDELERSCADSAQGDNCRASIDQGAR